jgi:hypothetical protein
MNFKNNELLMLGGAFILGVVMDRYMNHRDIVTGEVKEGVDTKKGDDTATATGGAAWRLTKDQSNNEIDTIILVVVGVGVGGGVLYLIYCLHQLLSEKESEEWEWDA